jgi:5-methylcytosine-specific restriction endonuclease McrA
MAGSDEKRRAAANALRKRKGTRPQYNLREYRRRAKAIVASGAKCVVCGKPATTANHRTPISKGGSLKGGLNAMCLKCASAQGGRASP